MNMQIISEGLYTPDINDINMMVVFEDIKKGELDLAKEQAKDYYQRYGVPTVIEVTDLDERVEGSYQFVYDNENSSFHIKLNTLIMEPGCLWHELRHARQTARVLRLAGKVGFLFALLFIVRSLPQLASKAVSNKLYYWLPSEIEAHWAQYSQHNGEST